MARDIVASIGARRPIHMASLLSAALVEGLAQKIAVARTELRDGQPLCTLPLSRAAELRAIAKLVLTPGTSELREAELRLRQVITRCWFGSNRLTDVHESDQAAIIEEADRVLQTVIALFAGQLPHLSWTETRDLVVEGEPEYVAESLVS